MFHLFGKKQPKEAEKTAQSAHVGNPEVAALAAQFDPEEFEIMAVTGAGGFDWEGADVAQFRIASLPLVAWREGDGPIFRQPARLVALADDTLLDYLRRHAPRDCIIQARVRKALLDERFLLVGLPSPMMEPELKGILLEETAPISTWAEGLGTFVLNRQFNWFQAEVDWMGQPVQLTYDRGQERDMEQSRETARALTAGQADWDGRLRTFAAERLLDQIQQLELEQEEESDPLTRSDLAARLELESVQVGPGGTFLFWFRDGDFSEQRFVRVTGDVACGPAGAELE